MTVWYSRPERLALTEKAIKTIEHEGPIKVIVCGGRDFRNKNAMFKALDEIHAKRPIDLVIHGGARGADTFAEEWAFDRGILSVKEMANWKAHGKSAGPIRNGKMLLDYRPHAVIAFPGGKGTLDMVSKAMMADVQVIQPLGG